jgi:hypothetical protein
LPIERYSSLATATPGGFNACVDRCAVLTDATGRVAPVSCHTSRFFYSGIWNEEQLDGDRHFEAHGRSGRHAGTPMPELIVVTRDWVDPIKNQ